VPNPSRRLLRQFRQQALQDLQRNEADLKSQIPNGKKQAQDLQEVINVLYGKAKGTRQTSVRSY
jgi:hypothetical protein